MIAGNDRIRALRPKSDDPGGPASAIAFLTERLTIVDFIVQHIQLPVLTPDGQAAAAGRGQGRPSGARS